MGASLLKTTKRDMKKYMKIGAVLFIVVIGLQFVNTNMFWAGGWETTIDPDSAKLLNVGHVTTKNLQYTSWQTGFDFDSYYYGAPDIWIQIQSWTHTDGTTNPVTQMYEKTEWDDYAKRFTLEHKQTLPQPDGSKIDAIITQEYDLHLFWTQVQIGTAASVSPKRSEDNLGNARFEHETSWEAHTVAGRGDLGTPAIIDVTLEVDISSWPIRNLVDDYQKAGIMNIQALPFPYHREGQVAITDLGGEAWKDKVASDSDNEYSMVPSGHMAAEGKPQSGVYQMKWEDQRVWAGRDITSQSDTAQLPTALPEKLLITPRVWLRAGFMEGRETGGFYHSIKALIPIDMYVQFGLLMEVLTVAEHTVYSDPYGITLTTPTKFVTYTPAPSQVADIGEIFGDLFNWFPGGLGGILGIVVLVVIAFFAIQFMPVIMAAMKSRK